MKTFTLLLLLATLIISLSTLNSSSATVYEARNNAVGTPGGDRFDHQIGLDYALDILKQGSYFFRYLFTQHNVPNIKNVTFISLTIQSMNGISTNIDSSIYINSNYIGNFSGNLKGEFTGIAYHEIARVLQWDGEGQAPIGLLTGIADFFRLKAGYGSARWVKAGEGSRWDEGFDVTMRFLEYCDGKYEGLVSVLNFMTKYGYNDIIFKEYTLKSVDELWNEYVAKYRG